MAENTPATVTNPLKKMELAIKDAKSVKDLLKIDVVSNRYISNYEAGTGRKDGKERYEREAFAFMEIANNNAEIMKCEPMSIFAGFIKAGLTGLSFSSGKLSIYPRGGKLVVEPDAHGKKEMLERMPTINKVDEGVVVYNKDVFVVDELNRKVVKHEKSYPTPVASKETVMAAYCTIHFTDGHREEVVMSINEIEIARSKSKQPNGIMWNNHYAEACKKTTYNRAYKVNYKQPETAVIYKEYDVVDADVEVVDDDGVITTVKASTRKPSTKKDKTVEAPTQPEPPATEGPGNDPDEKPFI